MRQNKDELSLVKNAFNRLIKHKDIKVICNVPLLGRCIDLVYMKDNRVFTVEFKLHDWRRAIKQAKDHRLGADYSYICMPRRRNFHHMIPDLRMAGVGLTFYIENSEWPFQLIEEAPKSEDIWSVAYNKLSAYLMSNHGNWSSI